ncbi:hypothetical protein BN7_2642 [Wickerhamomyces ciferrii]|uniref:[histone H3]-trimethyl-L-lysine(9) demethylase n=1 Tax=Wickerhamomyces ciferrii (strain ATCC 14091 / BCRC 22168 / CBS 111 / JCM 3599 / NBRC 0793 / NRRL Y-1031 F-60-10) TaxID=1206466 RepID=K0KDB1_WICCF|nr:uncharacterized protein BN7_2642 [Wickerhamomyces ciferrii]CCH43095.1 hypothetical protein BN7_2642 [Wickerhamomyces ciferrii]
MSSGTDIYSNVEPSKVVTGVPVFTPTMEQFKDFEKYMKAVNKFGMQSGIVKVVPPKEWIESSTKVTTEALKSIKIRNPIVQHINGNNGVFGQQNIEKQRTFNIVQWKALSEQPENQPPAPRGKARNPNTNAKLNKKILANKNHNDESLFEGFDYNIDTSEFTPERCEALERSYWKSLTYAQPMYGADMIGSIFDDTVKVWNVAHLPNALDFMDQKLPGVNDAYLYAGLWKATFSWHLEDQDLYSINYIHFGAPKQWYSIPQASKDRFDEVMRDTFTEDYKNCPDFLRHKTFLVSPAFLEARGVTVNRIVHNQQEFMITYPYGYHAGMNFGYNVAESVNFAIDEWFEYGLKTSKCLCVPDAVDIDAARLLRRVKGEPEPEPESDSEPELVGPDDDTDKLPELIHENDFNSFTSQSSIETQREAPLRLSEKQYTSPNKKRRLSVTIKTTSTKDTEKKHKGPQCILCPNNLSFKQTKSYDFELLKTEDHSIGGKPAFVHRICSRFIPETQAIIDIEQGEYVSGIQDIPNARKNLKCGFCHLKGGACFQCSDLKCKRAYHATCALPSGVHIVNDDEFYCKFHKVKPDNNYEYLSSLHLGDLIQAKFNDYFAGTIVANNKSEASVTIDIYPTVESTRNLLEVPYESICPQGVKIRQKARRGKKLKSPSPEIEQIASIPELKQKQELEASPPLDLNDDRHKSSNENYNDIKWAHEFFKNREVITVPNINTQELWYYKPGHSTDQIARFSNDINIKEPNDPLSIRYYRRKNGIQNKKIQPPIIPIVPKKSHSPPLHVENKYLPSSLNQNYIPFTHPSPADHSLNHELPQSNMINLLPQTMTPPPQWNILNPPENQFGPINDINNHGFQLNHK